MSNIQVTNIKNLSGNRTVAITSTTGELLVKNDLIAESGVEVAENLIVSGVSTFSSLLDINGAVDVSGIVTFSNNVDITQTLDVDGLTRLDDVSVSGITTFTNTMDNAFGNVNSGSVQIDGGLGVDKNVSIGGSLYVNGQSYFAESIVFASGGSGTLQFGNNANDTVDIQGQIGSNLIASADTTYDLGSSSKKWRNLFVDVNAGIGSLIVTGVSTFSGITTFTNDVHTQDLSVAGLSTFYNGIFVSSGNVAIDTGSLVLSTGGISAPGSSSNINWGSGNFYFNSGSPEIGWVTGDATIRALGASATVSIKGGNPAENMGVFRAGGAAELYYDNSKKIETTGTGVTVTGNIALIGDGRLIDFIGNTSNNDYETGIRWWESSGDSDPSMAIDYNGDSGLDSSGQIEIKGYNNNTTSYTELVVLDRFGRVGVGSTRPTHLVDVLGDSRFTGNVSVSGITTLGIVTGATYYGNGSNLTGITTSQISGYGGGIGGIGEIVQDTSPQLGGNLDLNSNNITGIGSINITGTVDVSGASTLIGDVNISGATTVTGAFDVTGISSFASGIVVGETTGSIDNRGELSMRTLSRIMLGMSGSSPSGLVLRNTSSGGEITHVNFGDISIEAGNGKSVIIGNSTDDDMVTINNSGVNITGLVTATSFVGDGGNLTSLTGASAGTYGDGGSIPIITVDSNGRITGISTSANQGSGEEGEGGGTLSSRSLVEGTTGSLAPNATGTLDLSGFKSYALMYVGLSTAGWIRIYTDSTSRTNDASRSIGDDPTPGSGVIAEVITTGISTQQNISPFVMGGNMDNTVSNTMYISITNLSSDTQTISVDLKILQLEA